MKNKILILLIIVAIALITSGLVLTLTAKDDKSEIMKKYTYSYENVRKVDVCNSVDCSIVPSEFPDLVYDTGNQAIQDVVNKINKETEKYYKQTKAYSTSDFKCKEVSNLYKYGNSVYTQFIIYESSKYTNITVYRIIDDLCTKNTLYTPMETYFYDKETKTMLSQKQLKEKFHITTKDIEDAISKNITSFNEITGLNYQLDNIKERDYVVHFDSDGNLVVSYFLSDTKAYNTAIINKK